MTDVKRIEPREAHRRVEEGDALLVCAYEDDDKCAKYGVPDAMNLSRFESRKDDLPAGKQVIFYCN